MEKQRRSADPAAATHLAKPHWQAKSQATPRRLLPANSRVKTADWRPPLLGPPAKVKLVVQYLEPQD
jgi:hypothetical protein